MWNGQVLTYKWWTNRLEWKDIIFPKELIEPLIYIVIPTLWADMMSNGILLCKNHILNNDNTIKLNLLWTNNPTNGQVLTYNWTTLKQEWQNITIPWVFDNIIQYSSWIAIPTLFPNWSTRRYILCKGHILNDDNIISINN